MSSEREAEHAERRARLSKAKELKLRQINEAQYQGILDAILSRKEIILSLDMYDLEKLSQVLPKALAVNSCCTG